MSGAFTSLFGGGEPSVATGPSQFQQLPGFAQEAFRQQFGGATQLAQQPELFAPTALPEQTLQGIELLGQAPTPLTAERFGEAVNIFQNPFEQQVVQNTIRDLQEQAAGVQSDIGQQASAAGGFGGTRQALLESELQRNLLRSIGDVTGGIRQRGFETASQQALGRLGREEDLQRQQALGLLTGGGLLQQQATGERRAPLEALQFLRGQIGALPTAGGATTSSQQQGILPRIGQAAGGLGVLGGAASGLGSLFSDRRLKRDIRKAGTKNGFNIYKFRYWNDDQNYSGVMADEVEDIMPEAVGTHGSGFKTVNYGMLGIEFMRA